MRLPPHDALDYNWEKFEALADLHGIGENLEDWRWYWDFWKLGYFRAIIDYKL